MTVAAALLLVAPAAAQNVLDAEPTVRIDSAENAATRRVLPDLERAKNRVIIVKRDGKYLWASREGRELIHRVSGMFHCFIDPTGGGYVKILDSHEVPLKLRTPGPRYRFMEHVTEGLGSITYWGGTDDFQLHPDP
jgi:hypothetical protein